jgi:hypothetical protein
MKEKLPPPIWVVGTESIGLGVGRYMDSEEPHLAIDNPGVGVLQSNAASSEGLDL